jgi:hypothetical protein
MLVIPAEAGIQDAKARKLRLDTGLRRYDENLHE